MADAFSRRSMIELRAIFSRLSLYKDGSLLAEFQVRPNLVDEINSKQPLDSSFVPHVKQIEEDKTIDIRFNSEGILCYRGRYCVPLDRELRQFIL